MFNFKGFRCIRCLLNVKNNNLTNDSVDKRDRYIGVLLYMKQDDDAMNVSANVKVVNKRNRAREGVEEQSAGSRRGAVKREQ